MFEEIYHVFNGLEIWQQIIAICILIAVLAFGMLIGPMIILLGIISLMISFVGFLIFADVDFSFKKPLMAIGIGFVIFIIGSFVYVWYTDEQL